MSEMSTARGGPCRAGFLLLCGASLAAAGCVPGNPAGQRVAEGFVAEDAAPAFLERIESEDDFSVLACAPMNASIPTALEVKTVVDRIDGDRLYYQNGKKFPMHWDFAHRVLSGHGLPVVPEVARFNTTEYYSPDRRFVLGAVTHYGGPDVWVYEIAPYDTADAAMITMAFRAVEGSSFFGGRLSFHPTSRAVETAAGGLPASVRVITTDELFEGIDYQPLNHGASTGRLRFVRADDIETEHLDYRDIIVLDGAPEQDIPVVLGVVTAQFQTPLSHINVLSLNRGHPNMALRGAWDDERLRSLEGAWVRLEVAALDFSIEEVGVVEADAWWEDNGPEPIDVPSFDCSVTDLRDVEDVLDPGLGIVEAVNGAIPAFGSHAATYAGLTRIGGDAPASRAFVVPVSRYRQFMQDSGLHALALSMLGNPGFLHDPAERLERLQNFRTAIMEASLDPEFEAMLIAKLEDEYPDRWMRFSASSNAQYLEDMPGWNLFASFERDPGASSPTVSEIVRMVWASLWRFATYQELSYRGIDLLDVGMALLVQESAPTGGPGAVAMTANPYDTSGLESGFHVIAQVAGVPLIGDAGGVAADEFVYHYDHPGRPLVFVSHSSLVAAGETVLTPAQTLELGAALEAVHELYRPLHGAEPGAWYAMALQVAFSADAGDEPALLITHANPHPGWGIDRPVCE